MEWKGIGRKKGRTKRVQEEEKVETATRAAERSFDLVRNLDYCNPIEYPEKNES